eukprot:XP_019918087.1 PREDICTED: phosphatidylinositol-binding clathrin assembly protein LAP-like isoform X6 [Crassostrea gigas]
MGMAWCKKNFTKCSEKYFDMNKKQCKDALEIYKRFLVRMDKVPEFLKTAESVGIDKSDIPDLAKDTKVSHYKLLKTLMLVS